ncbi:MAG: SIMPL domain-containing protein [Bacteroidales bacterium]|nr:SIMPL domain-containing protein [Bacteroidales bacterium]MBQ4442286.1 SIMPL domain-containing protein [Bacteroidales bacterium]MCR4856746.1 SIMPL domain-containing protein [Bacteroidales bacterium]
MNNKSVTIAIIVGIAFFLAALALGIAFYQTKKPVKTVSVVGLAEKDFTSDLIVWNIQYDVIENDMKTSYTKIKEQAAIVKEFLQSKGIKDSEMDFKNISTDRKMDSHWENGHWVERFVGYESRQTVRIESKDVDKIEKVIRAISELYEQNINIDSWNPEYYYTKLADLKIEMLAEASKNARERAETITKNAGGRLGDLKTATTGVFQITAPNSADEDYSWGGAFNTSSKQKHVSINMRQTYYVK